MNKDNAIEVKNVKKKFKVYYDKGNQLKERLLFKNRNRYEERWVLNGVSFEVKKGEAIGLIGHNGCGKSTTLKLLTRIMYPDEGTIEMNGRVSSLIELGAGFHPDMSGRENIYTNASIFGLTKAEIDERMDDIIEFSEMEPFLDNPVRTYSSGMYMRLAFSVAINVNADILLIDEILAVGDVNFQAKCFNKLREIKAQGTTIVIVSHSMGQIEQICDRSIWIHEGLIKGEGVPRDIDAEYLEFMGEKRQEIADKEAERRQEKEAAEAEAQKAEEEKKEAEAKKVFKEEGRWGNGHAYITKIQTFDADKKPKTVFATGDTMTFVIDYKVEKPVKDAVVGISITRVDGIHVYGSNTDIDRVDSFDLTEDGQMSITLRDVKLLPCVYLVDIAIQDKSGETMDYYKNAYKFEIYSKYADVGLVRVDHTWDI